MLCASLLVGCADRHGEGTYFETYWEPAETAPSSGRASVDYPGFGGPYYSIGFDMPGTRVGTLWGLSTSSIPPRGTYRVVRFTGGESYDSVFFALANGAVLGAESGTVEITHSTRDSLAGAFVVHFRTRTATDSVLRTVRGRFGVALP